MRCEPLRGGYLPGTVVRVHLPVARGPLSAALIEHIQRGFDLTNARVQQLHPYIGEDPHSDGDIQLSLWMLYELHYRGFDDAGANDMEWAPGLIAVRNLIERSHEFSLRSALMDSLESIADEDLPIDVAMFGLPDRFPGPSLSAYLAKRANLGHFREFLVHRTAYHSKEADPYTWVIPRLPVKAKSALVEIQADEYGGGRPQNMHSELFNLTLREVGLDDTYGAYIDLLPAVTLAAANTVSMFGLHRRLRAAAAGHFAALEMTSSIPNRKYGNGLRRLGFGEDATRFFDEHVEADAVHEQLAVRNLCANLADEEPESYTEIIFGALTYLEMESRIATDLLSAWAEKRSALLPSGGQVINLRSADRDRVEVGFHPGSDLRRH